MKEIEKKIQVLFEEIATQRAMINMIRKDLLNINAKIALLDITLNKMRGRYEGPSNN